ncbi:type VII secretion-associated serine protease mycosin [Streptomyces sp. NPDC051994]|uniref:type VII secretion-associated serine protease mycosin n=1 Tax=unclassified Streptomyces TaxID=2593676 RepID=UPI003425D8EF
MPTFRMSRGAMLLAPIATAIALLITPAAHADDTVRSSEWPLDSDHFRAGDIWKLTRGDGVTVAVIDSGVAADHPDLAGRVLPGTSLLGDRSGGNSDTSSDSHGTAIAGIIAATGASQHGTGMTGLAPKAEILPVRVTAGGSVTPGLLAQAITWAADHGASVINVSIGTTEPDALLHQAVTYALRKNVVVVASAGNNGLDGNEPMYPAAFPGVVSVSGVDQNGDFWENSERGHGTTVAAPAADIASTNDQGHYVNADGTSYAAAYVSAAVALVRSRYPHLTSGQVIRRLTATAHRHHDAPDQQVGYGEIDPLGALTTTMDPGDAANPLLSAASASSSQPHVVWRLVGLTGAATAIFAAAAWLLLVRKRRAVAGPAPVHRFDRVAAGSGNNRKGTTRPTIKSQRRSSSKRPASRAH